MKRTAIVILILAFALAGCANTAELPIATSILADGASAAPTPTPEYVQPESSPLVVEAVQPPFDKDDKFLGLQLFASRNDVQAVLGPPDSTADENGRLMHVYDGFRLGYSELGGEWKLTFAEVSAPGVSVIRGIMIGDEFGSVINKFYIQENVVAADLVDYAVLYESRYSTPTTVLPPRGVISFAEFTADFTLDGKYDTMAEYSYPLSDYDDDILYENPKNFIFKEHVMLRFYFQKNVLMLSQITVSPYETVENPGGTDVQITPVPAAEAELAPAQESPAPDVIPQTPQQ